MARGNTSNAPRDYLITSVDRALRILKLFVPTNEPMSLMDICYATGLHKSTILRMVYTLCAHGMLQMTHENKKYVLGTGALQLGLTAQASLDITRIAEPIFRSLADRTGFVVHMGVFEDNNVVLITKVFPVNKAFNIRLASRIGGILPTYCTGIGLLFLAHQEDSYVREYLSGCDLTTYTSTTVTDLEKIMERISQIQADGYVINNGEHDEGIISFCAPIYDHTGQMVAGMSTGGIREIAARVGYDGLLAQTLEAARQVSQELGG